MEVGENEYQSVFCLLEFENVKTRIRKGFNPTFFNQFYSLSCDRRKRKNRFERYYYHTHTLGGDKTRCLSHRYHFSTNCTINFWKDDARHQWDYTPYPPKISDNPNAWDNNESYGYGDADQPNTVGPHDKYRRSSPTFPKILLEIHSLLMGDFALPRPFNSWYWKEVSRVRHYQEWVNEFEKKFTHLFLPDFAERQFNIFSCHYFTLENVKLMLKKYELTLMKGAGKFKVELKKKKGILPAETAYSPLNHFWSVDYISQPLTGAYLTPQFRLEEYLNAVEKLNDPNRVEKLLILV